MDHPFTHARQVYTCILAGVTGFIYILGLLFSTTDIDGVGG